MQSVAVRKLVSTVTVLIILLSIFSLIPFNGSPSDGSIHTSSDSLWKYRFCDSARIGVILTSGVKGKGAYLGRETNLKIPETVDGYRVSGIGEYAFYGRSDLCSVELPYTLEEISNYAFALCTSLVELRFPESIREIGDYSFFDCTALKNAEFRTGIRSIGYRAFYSCSSLENVTIPEGIENISQQAFEGTAVLGGVNSSVYINGCLLRADTACTDTFNVENGTTVIAGGAFEGCDKIRSISLPDTLSFVSDGGFEGCEMLESITLPDAVIRVGEFAFSHCTALKSIGVGSKTEYLGDGLAYDCPSLEKIDVSPENEQYASSDGVLYDNEAKELIRYPSSKQDAEFTMPDSVISVSASAFKDCSCLEKVVFSRRIKTVSSNSFENCSALKTVTLPDRLLLIDANAFYKCASLKEIDFPESLREIGPNAFSLCTSLEKVVLPDNLESVKDLAFTGCTALKAVSMKNCKATFGKGAFRHCDSIERIVLPDSIIQINSYMFADCASLRQVNFGSSVQIVGYSAFKNCTSLESLSLPEKVYSIKSNAFSDCTSLTEVTLSEGLEMVGTAAFEGCSSLESVILPDSLKSIGDNAFKSCASLRNLTVGKNVAVYGTEILADSPSAVSGYIDTNASDIALDNGAEFISLGYAVWDDPDMPKDSWYYEPMSYCINRGYMTGFDKGDYRPLDDITREDFIMLLSRAAGAELESYNTKDCPFEDVDKQSYYAASVMWALDKGVINGYSEDKFGTGITVSREQAVTMLYRYCGSPSVSDADEILTEFEDAENIDGYAFDAFAWAVGSGLVQGMSETELAPDEPVSRASASMLIMRLTEDVLSQLK